VASNDRSFVRNFLIALGIFLLFLFLADWMMKALAEERVADQMQESLELSDRPTVSIDAWPFVVQVMDGHFDSVTVDARDVNEGGIRLKRVELFFDDVDFPAAQLLSQKKRSVEVDGATGTAVITEQDLTRALRSNGIPATVILTGDAAVVETDVGADAAATVSLDGGDLVLVPEEAIDPVIVELPPMTDEVDYKSARIDDGRAVIALEVGRTTLEF
jgi:hypothetical protein